MLAASLLLAGAARRPIAARRPDQRPEIVNSIRGASQRSHLRHSARPSGRPICNIARQLQVGRPARQLARPLKIRAPPSAGPVRRALAAVAAAAAAAPTSVTLGRADPSKHYDWQQRNESSWAAVKATDTKRSCVLASPGRLGFSGSGSDNNNERPGISLPSELADDEFGRPKCAPLASARAHLSRQLALARSRLPN